jgi:arsenite oxidase small subunit
MNQESVTAMPSLWESHDARREFLHGVGCLAATVISSGLPVDVLASEDIHRYQPSRLVNEFGESIRSQDLKLETPYVFNYPFRGTPAFLIRLKKNPTPLSLKTEDGRVYKSTAGVGIGNTVVAFSAICAHKMMYPTPNISFIGLRKGQGNEPSAVIHCCGDDSRYDPLSGGRVLGGPAPQPLACIVLRHQSKDDSLRAIGTLGGEMFKAFFEKYSFKLTLDNGPRSADFSPDTAVCKELTKYSRQLQTCPA